MNTIIVTIVIINMSVFKLMSSLLNSNWQPNVQVNFDETKQISFDFVGGFIVNSIWFEDITNLSFG